MLRKVNEHPDKVWSIRQSNEGVTLRLLLYHQRGFMVSIAQNLLVAHFMPPGYPDIKHTRRTVYERPGRGRNITLDDVRRDSNVS